MVGIVGNPILVPRDLDRAALRDWVQFVEQQLLELTELADDWAVRIRRQGSSAQPPCIRSNEPMRKSA
jgi:hypothetical protein